MRFFHGWVLGCLCLQICAEASFLVQSSGRTRSRKHNTSALLAGGFGGGAAAPARKRAAKGTSSASFDVGASLLRLEKKYDELSVADSKRMADKDDLGDLVTTEYVVAVRPKMSFIMNTGVLDWVPVAQILLTRPHHTFEQDDDSVVSQPILCAAVSFYCRELAQTAAMGSRAFASIPRNQLEYSLESTSSFYKHVYDNIVEDNNGIDNNMTNAQAKQVLGLGNTANLELAVLKQAYRQLAMEWHPDRKPRDQQLQASQQYANIKLAYETLLASGSVRQSNGNKNNQSLAASSWYESLGGRERTDFLRMGQLLNIATAQQVLKGQRVESAVVGLDPDLVQSFVARSRARR